MQNKKRQAVQLQMATISKKPSGDRRGDLIMSRIHHFLLLNFATAHS